MTEHQCQTDDQGPQMTPSTTRMAIAMPFLVLLWLRKHYLRVGRATSGPAVSGAEARGRRCGSSDPRE
jgi:hypothetical protein